MAIRANLTVLAVLATVSGGCGDGGERRDNAVTDVVRAERRPADASPTTTPKPPPPPVVSSVPIRLAVTTTEPFYHAEIDGDRIVLTGVTTLRRDFAVLDRQGTADSRRWRASDAVGDIVVGVTRALCSDGMSDARYDLAATLTFDGRTVRGCAYSGRPPAERTAATIPARFLGRWNTDRAACAKPATSIEGLRITPTELVFHESAGTVTAVRETGPDTVEIAADYEGEGERWTATQTLRVTGDRLSVTQRGSTFSRLRCPDRG